MQANANAKAGPLAEDQANPLNCSPAEWAARIKLAGTYRVFHMIGWTEMIFNHVSLRVPGEDGGFLLNPFGLHYSEVTASNLVKVDAQGQLLSPSGYGVNPAGFVPHSTIHRGIERAHCVMHTHTTSGSAVACYEGGLSMDNFYSAQLLDRVAYHDFEGITVRGDEGPRLLKSIGDRQAVILRNHGLLAWGHSIDAAFAVLWTLQRACDIQVATASLGKAIPISRPVQEQCARDTLQFNDKKNPGHDILDAMIRLVDRQVLQDQNPYRV
jgi:ribulose-5-phosphate 4-epimerase/fuculose-1-phosphate aldolase